MNKYDAVIVGAGPAGLNCAKVLSDNDKTVLLLEKNDVIGPKVCAGGLPYYCKDYLKLPTRLLDDVFNEGIIHTPIQKTVVKLGEPFIFTISRKNLGQWQLKKLKKSKTEIRTNAKVIEVGKNHVIINNSERVNFKNLIGADGSASIVRRYLGIKSKEKYLSIQYIIPTSKFRKFEIFFDSKLFHSWYAWIFPHNNYASIGCGCNPKVLSGKRLKNNFGKWLDHMEIDISKAQFQCQPVNVDFQGYKFGDIFLIGDAAGLASGFTGEGIYPALISGEEVARTIIDKNHVAKKLKELIWFNEYHKNIIHIFKHSGPIRALEYELITFLLKNKLAQKRLIHALPA